MCLSSGHFELLGIAIHCIQHSQAMLERGVCELAHSFFHSAGSLFLCLPVRALRKQQHNLVPKGVSGPSIIRLWRH